MSNNTLTELILDTLSDITDEMCPYGDDVDFDTRTYIYEAILTRAPEVTNMLKKLDNSNLEIPSFTLGLIIGDLFGIRAASTHSIYTWEQIADDILDGVSAKVNNIFNEDE